MRRSVASQIEYWATLGQIVEHIGLSVQEARTAIEQYEVGAINVLERGQRLLACGEEGSGRCRKTPAKPVSVKQEPTEVTMREASHA